MEAAQSSPQQQLVFICDDDADIAEVTELIVLRNNYRVKVFSFCEKIPDEAEKLQPALILLDLWMPKMGGERVTRLLKKNPATRHIPVYLFSATRDLDYAVKRTGADGFINKPYDINELEMLIHSVIDKKAR